MIECIMRFFRNENSFQHSDRNEALDRLTGVRSESKRRFHSVSSGFAHQQPEVWNPSPHAMGILAIWGIVEYNVLRFWGQCHLRTSVGGGDNAVWMSSQTKLSHVEPRQLEIPFAERRFYRLRVFGQVNNFRACPSSCMSGVEDCRPSNRVPQAYAALTFLVSDRRFSRGTI